MLMRAFRSILLIRILACLLPLFYLPMALSQPITLVCSTDNPSGSLHVVALEKFAELLQRYSKGKIQASIHYRGHPKRPALGGEEENTTMLMRPVSATNPLHLAVMASGNLSLKVRSLEFLMLPYLFDDQESAQHLFNSPLMQDELNQRIAKQHNMRVLGWLIGGYRNLTNSRRPITQIEHIKGLIIRTPRSRIMRDTYRSFGAIPLPLNWSETFDALKNQIADGQENPYSVIVNSKFWDANQRFVTNNQPFLWVGAMAINERFFQSLTPSQQDIVTRAARAAAEYEWQWVAQQNSVFLKVLRSHGMQIDELQDLVRWKSASQSLWKQYYAYIGYGDAKQGQALIERVLSILSPKTQSAQ